MAHPTASSLLREVREAARLSRRDLAARAAVSEESIRSYESGRRTPSRSALVQLLDRLSVDPMRRGEIIEAFGYSEDAVMVGTQADSPFHSLDEALVDIATLPWPAHVNTEFFEVVGANAAMQRLWQVDLGTLGRAVERNMMIGLCTPRWADRIENWDEAMRLCAAILKGGYGDQIVGPDGPNPYFEAVINRFLQGDPGYVQRFLAIWADVTPHVNKWRFAFPITWCTADGARLRFRVSVNPVNLDRYMTISEWLPLDAETWQSLPAPPEAP